MSRPKSRSERALPPDDAPSPRSGRRRGLRIAWATAVVVASALTAQMLLAGPSRTAPGRLNVLVLVMDTTRADRCSFLGYARPTTPRLASFAKDAVAYRDAWSPAGWTGPAHASLFTGMRPEHHGFHDGDRNYLGDEFPTLAESLSRAGYATAAFTNNDFIAPEFGLTRGFDKVTRLSVDPGRAYPWAKETHRLAAEFAEGEARAGRPFFVFVNDMEPHLPYTPPADDQARFLRGDPLPDEVADARAFDLQRATAFALGGVEITPRKLGILSDLYDGEIAALDREIGTLFDRLSADGLLDSTIVVVAGDHGELLGDHHMLQHGHSLHRAARHVPLLVRLPGLFDGGRTVESVVRLEDVAPTILEACGRPVPDGLDGASLAHDVDGRVSIAVQGAFPGRRERLAASNPGLDPTPFLLGIEAVYDGRFHCLSFSDGRRELFDVANDPDERTNVASRRPDDLARLLSLVPAQR